MEKEYLKNTLENMLMELNFETIERHNWYSNLFQDELSDIWQDEKYCIYEDGNASCENVLAIEAIEYPELHPLMEQIVLRITEYGEQGRFQQIWENEEVQAGGALARELACYDKQYIPLYYRYIQTNDLDHEVYQLEDMLKIFEKWDYSKETLSLMIYRGEFGQSTDIYPDLVRNICKTKEEAVGYLKEANKYFVENWSFTYAEDPDDQDIIQLSEIFEPLFADVLEIDEERIQRFVMRYNNMMAKGEEPSLEELIRK